MPIAATAFSFVILVAVLALCVGLPAWIAARKGRNPWLWGVLGFLFPLIALIVIALLSPKNETIEPPQT